MISDFDLPLLKFVSVPKDFHGLNCAAFAAGAVRGALAAADAANEGAETTGGLDDVRQAVVGGGIHASYRR